MKRLVSVVVCVLLLICSASAEELDLSAMTFDELVALREQLNLAIWESEEWQEVTVPAGVWKVGEDIPAGHWTIRPIPNTYILVTYCDKLNEYGKEPAIGWQGWCDNLTARGEKDLTYGEPREVDLDMVDGMYLLNSGTVIITPYTGKPDLGFK